MNRRQFTTSLDALAAVPVLPLKALASAGTAIPNPARFWAIYMSHLHGTRSAATLTKAAGINSGIARGYLSRLVAEGVLTPTKVLGRTVATKAVQPAKQTTNAGGRLKKFLNKHILEEKGEIADDSPSVNHNQAKLDHDDPKLAAAAPPAKDPS